MTDSLEHTVSNEDRAGAFLEFQYAEIKDLTKQFLTVVAAVLAISVTFSEKIVNFAEARTASKVLMIVTWGLCLFAFTLGGFAMYLIYNAGAAAKYAVLTRTPGTYWVETRRAYLCLRLAGLAFVLALVLLVVVGILRIF